MIYRIISHVPVQLIVTTTCEGGRAGITVYILQMNKPRLKLMICWRSQGCKMAKPTATEMK